MKTKRIGSVQKKIFAVLLAGTAMSLSRSPRQHLKILTEELPKEFAKINMQSMEYGLHRLYKAEYVGLRKSDNGLYIPYLTREGRKLAQEYNLDALTVPTPVTWDKKWRVVSFDIPEKRRKIRDFFRHRLYQLQFKEIQKSVFCLPYECGKEIMTLAKAYRIERHILYTVCTEINKEAELRQHFGL